MLFLGVCFGYCLDIKFTTNIIYYTAVLFFSGIFKPVSRKKSYHRGILSASARSTSVLVPPTGNPLTVSDDILDLSPSIL